MMADGVVGRTELYFKMQVDAGLKELDEGKGIFHKEVEQRIPATVPHLSINI